MTVSLWSVAPHEGRQFNPTRLTSAREQRGLTKQVFAQHCGVSRRTVSAWEAGDVDHPPVPLISRVLDYPESYFFSDDAPEISEDWVSFRALSAMTAKQVHRMLATSSVGVEFSNWMDANYRTPNPDIPDLSEVSDLVPASAAEHLRSIWGQHEKPIKNMMKLLENKGVRIFSLPSDDREVDAFCFTREGRDFIFINTAKSAERRRFDLAHELGHLVLHQKIRKNRSKQLEDEANEFASSFLMPGDAVIAQVRGRLTLADVFMLKGYWKVSAVAMVERLFRLQLISEWQRRQWLIDLTKRGFRTAEPDGIPPEISTLLGQLLRVAREDGWTVPRIARILGVPDDLLNKLTFDLKVPAVAGDGLSSAPLFGHLRLVQ